ncbi:hypothetical protein TGP89_418650 [Toxoplasma gondii p89]|uniref:Uncharacterized protein n=1 Tax=Toxoplasma gondii p89 TaxID=943119 RepID=A0A086L063_TOXGO|nr:hypothetical protein TGP89_418650 [Toxoplasma gondii p89]
MRLCLCTCFGSSTSSNNFFRRVFQPPFSRKPSIPTTLSRCEKWKTFSSTNRSTSFGASPSFFAPRLLWLRRRAGPRPRSRGRLRLWTPAATNLFLDRRVRTGTRLLQARSATPRRLRRSNRPASPLRAV